MSGARFLVGDVFEGLAALEAEGTQVDLVLTSPPFLALRSYLPPDHPDKGKEIGSEPTPADFLDTMLAVVEACADVLAPHGSICFEFGDTYSGSGGAGGDYAEGGLRDGQERFDGSASRAYGTGSAPRPPRSGRSRDWPKNGANPATRSPAPGWPLDKSLCMIPELFAASLAYGRNLLRPERDTDPWRVRNTVAWVRPNPPVGALGDKVRPAKSLLTWACKARDRWFDLDAVRTEAIDQRVRTTNGTKQVNGDPAEVMTANYQQRVPSNPAGAPPLDWWKISPGGYSGKVSTTKRVRCGPDDGGERTTSPDCPVHADLPGQLPKALRDGRAAAQSPRTPRSDDRHAQAQLDGFAPTDGSLDRSGSSPDPTTASSDPQCSPVATPRSTASSRTGPVPATSPPGTASGRSLGRIGDTSTSPRSGEPHPDTLGSSTSADGSDGSRPSPDPHTAGTGTGPTSTACTCSFWRTVTESSSHYAVYPPELCRIPIEASCPRRVCLTCGTPSRRETEAGYTRAHGGSTGARRNLAEPAGRTNGTGMTGKDVMDKHVTTTGWTTCGCPGTDGIRLDGYHTGAGWRPGIVLDPFGGSGTTGLVATGLSRDAILIDLDARNADLATERLGMFLTVEHLATEGAA